MDDSAPPIVLLEEVGKIYVQGGTPWPVLQGVSFRIDVHEYVAIVGASGSGKSTLLSILGCLARPSSGRYTLAGRDVQGLGEDELARLRNEVLGFVFQSFNLLPRASALENVMQPLVYRRVPLAERRRRASVLLERLGLGERLHHRPNQLSGGQCQRVAIARALVGRPRLLLADEPTGNLDSQASADVLALFDELHAEGQTIVLVTHDPGIAARLPRQIRLHDGRVIADERAPDERTVVSLA